MKLSSLAYRPDTRSTRTTPRRSSHPNAVWKKIIIDIARCIRTAGLASGMLAIGCAQGSTGQSSSEGGGPSGTNGSTSAGTGGSSGNATSQASSGAMGSGSGGSSGAGGMSSASSGAGASGGAMAASGSGGAGGASPCLPVPSDTLCQICAKVNCCPEWEACQMSAVCTCWVPCFLAGGTTMVCTQMCGAVDPATTSLNMCQQNAGCTCP